MNALSLLVKPVSSRCNMKCGYCFYASSDCRTPAPDTGAMPAETLEKIVEKAIAATDAQLHVGFQGGEPTLAGLDFFKTLLEHEKKHNTKNLDIRHTLQTNGLLIDEEWARFLGENNFLTGLSLDANKQIHDRMRPDAAGKDTHNRVAEAARLLAKHNAHFTVMTVVTKALAAHPDKTYRYFKDRNLRHIQFIPCQDPIGDGHGSGAHSLSAAAYGKFLCRIFDLWHKDFVSGDYYSIRSFDNYVHMLAGHSPESCAMAGQCQNQMIVDANGDVYPCDFYIGEKDRIGNILADPLEELKAGEKALSFAAVSAALPEDCAACQYFIICRSGCRRDREPCGLGDPGKNVYCEAYREFFHYSLPRLRQLAAKLFAS